MIMTVKIVEYFSISLPVIRFLDPEGRSLLVKPEFDSRELLSPGQFFLLSDCNHEKENASRAGYLGPVEESAGNLVVNVHYSR